MLQIYLFGQLRAYYNDVPLKLALRPKAYPLWVYLLLNQKQSVDRNHLAFTLWPDVPEKKARTNLRRHLYYVRQALPEGHEWIVADNRTVQWNRAAPSWTDAIEFEVMAQADDSLTDAIDLYTADLLPNLYEDWLFYHRERLRDIYFNTLNRLSQQAAARGDYTDAILHTQKILAHDPLRENSLRQLLRLQYGMGNRSGAIAEYERFTRHLADELGVDPMPKTVALYEQIVRNALPDPTHTQPTAVSTPTPPTKRPLPFVGREQEMMQLHNWWHRVHQGQGQFIFLAGEAGIGKTRLTTEFAEQVVRQNGRFLIGHTSFTEPTPYQAVMEALQKNISLLVNLDIAPLWLSALRPLLPELGTRIPGLPTAVSLAPEQEQARLFEAIYRCLLGFAQTRPLLLVLEDLHWASPTTIALLESLARRLQQSAILLIATYREEETSRIHPLRRLRRSLQRQNLISHLTIGRLPPDAVSDLVFQVVKAAQVPDLAQKLYQRSEGNPLFIQELIHELHAHPQIDWEAFVPGGVRQIIMQRLAQLSENARTLAEITAVIGPAFDVELIRELSGWDEGEILDALDLLQDRYLIREAGRRDRFDYTFTHQLIQVTIYEDIPPRLRRRRHRRVAQMVAELNPRRLHELAATIAHHFDAARQPAAAVPHYLTAARHSLTLYADEEALTFLARALALAQSPQEKYDLYHLRQQIYYRLGDWDRQREDLLTLSDLAQQLDETDKRRETIKAQIQHYHACGNREKEKELIEALQALVPQSASSYWQAESLRIQADYAAIQAEYDEAIPLYKQALQRYEQLHDSNGRIQCLCALANIATSQSDFEHVRLLVREAEALSAQGEVNQLSTIEAIHTAANALFVRQDFAQSEALCRQGLALAAQNGYREGEAGFHKLLGAICSRRFLVTEAQTHYQSAHELYDMLGKRQGQAAILMNMAILESRLGNYEAGMEAFARAEQLFAQLKDLRGQTISAINLGATAIFMENFSVAKETSERAVVLAQKMGSVHLQADALGNLGEALRELGELQTAVSTLQTCISLRRSLDSQRVNLVSDMRELALVYLLMGNDAAAEETAVDFLNIFAQDPGAMLTPHYTFWIASQVFRRNHKTERANSLLQQAYDSLHMHVKTLPNRTTRQTFLQRRMNKKIIRAYDVYVAKETGHPPG